MVKKNYYNNSVSNLEGDVHASGSHYFDNDTKRFFGSSIKRDDVYKSESGDSYIFKETLSNAPEGAFNKKVVEFDVKSGRMTDLYKGSDNREANKILKESVRGYN